LLEDRPPSKEIVDMASDNFLEANEFRLDERSASQGEGSSSVAETTARILGESASAAVARLSAIQPLVVRAEARVHEMEASHLRERLMDEFCCAVSRDVITRRMSFHEKRAENLRASANRPAESTMDPRSAAVIRAEARVHQEEADYLLGIINGGKVCCYITRGEYL
jgi:hypothetical protein